MFDSCDIFEAKESLMKKKGAVIIETYTSVKKRARLQVAQQYACSPLLTTHGEKNEWSAE